MSRNGDERTEIPDAEVAPRAERRRFSAGEKLPIPEEAEACKEPGEMGALQRREGVYSSYVSRWRQTRDRGKLTALRSQQRGPKPATDAALVREVAGLRRDNERLQARLGQAEATVKVPKKLSQLLGPSAEGNESKERR